MREGRDAAGCCRGPQTALLCCTGSPDAPTTDGWLQEQLRVQGVAVVYLAHIVDEPRAYHAFTRRCFTTYLHEDDNHCLGLCPENMIPDEISDHPFLRIVIKLDRLAIVWISYSLRSVSHPEQIFSYPN